MSTAYFRKNVLTLMSKRRMTDIVPQGNGLNQILIEPEKAANGPGNARNHLHMQHPVGDMVVVHQGEDLSFIDIAGVGFGMEDTVGILGKRLAMVSQDFPSPADGIAAEASKSTESGVFPIIQFLLDSV